MRKDKIPKNINKNDILLKGKKVFFNVKIPMLRAHEN